MRTAAYFVRHVLTTKKHDYKAQKRFAAYLYCMFLTPKKHKTIKTQKRFFTYLRHF